MCRSFHRCQAHFAANVAGHLRSLEFAAGRVAETVLARQRCRRLCSQLCESLLEIFRAQTDTRGAHPTDKNELVTEWIGDRDIITGAYLSHYRRKRLGYLDVRELLSPYPPPLAFSLGGYRTENSSARGGSLRWAFAQTIRTVGDAKQSLIS